MPVSFDGENLIITLEAGVTTLDAENGLYVAWKNWQLAGNMRYPQAFRTIGGDSLTPGVDAGAYFFIQNDLGWRIKPPEEDIAILLTGNLSPEDSSLPILIPTTGAFTVLVQGIQPITQNIDTIKTTLELASLNGQVIYDEVNGVPITSDLAGTYLEPVANITDAVTVLEAQNFDTIRIKGSAGFDATKSLDNYKLIGDNQSQTVITFTSADTGDMSVEDACIQGSMSGALFAHHCAVNGVTGVGCTTNISTFKDVVFLGDLTLRADNDQDIHLLSTDSGVAGVTTFSLDVNGTSGDLIVHHHKGGIKLLNITTAINVTIDGTGTHVTIDASCTATASNIVIRGATKITNNSSIEVVDQTRFTTLEKLLRNKTVTDPVTGIMTVYDDDGTTVLYTANIYENVGGTTPYQGNAVNRRDRLG